jgi:F-box DNA helicase 1
MTLTPEQKTVVNQEVERGAALKIVAYAGTGKTTTFVEYANARFDSPMLYLAFNKSVETEAKERFGPNVRPRTVHALAYGVFGRNFRNIRGLRYFTVMKLLKADVYGATLVSKTLDNWWNSADPIITKKHAAADELKRYKPGYEDQLVKGANFIWSIMQKDNDQLSMTHSGYLKLYQLSQPRITSETILLDEAQDCNPVTLDIVNRQRAFGTRVLLCGDPYQQIYSWRGAIDAMNMVEAPTLYLTQSFRFGNEIARVANQILSLFFNCTVPVIGRKDIQDELPVQLPKDERYTIICRTNVEIFRQALRCAEQQLPICMVGGDGFTGFLEAVMDVYYLYCGNRKAIRDRQIAFFKHFDDLVEFAAARLDPELQARVSIVSEQKDRTPTSVETIRKMITVARLAKVFLVTAHKAKGLEWDNVMLADDFSDLFDDEGDLLPVSTGDSEEDLRRGYARAIPRDEVNLLYVAATRAKKRLRLNHDLRVLCSAKWS